MRINVLNFIKALSGKIFGGKWTNAINSWLYDMCCHEWSRSEKTRFLEKVFRFLVFLGFLGFLGLTYEDRTQNYDPKIHEEYLIHDTPFLLHIL